MNTTDSKSLPQSRRLISVVGILEETRILENVAEAQRIVGEVARELEANEKTFSSRQIRAFTIGAIFSALVVYAWFQPDRFVVINAAHPIKLDRWTGRTWTRHSEFGGWQEENTR